MGSYIWLLVSTFFHLDWCYQGLSMLKHVSLLNTLLPEYITFFVHLYVNKHLGCFWMLSCQWCYPTISSSVFPFSSCLQSFPASGSFVIIQLVASGGWNFGAAASASILPKNIQGWFPLGMTGWISLLFKRLSRVFFNTTGQKHQFFSPWPSLWSNSHNHTWLLGKP